MVVFAGAGSGKTRIITHRIAWLIEQGVKPWEILAVTFTNKAAREMRERVESLTPKAGRTLIATFHAACARWLREFATELGFTADFTIYDDGDQLGAIKAVLRELNVRLDGETTAREYRAAINRAKTLALLPGDERLARDFGDSMPPAGIQVYRRYQEYLASCNAMDFGDLIMNVLLLLRRNQVVREHLQQRYRFILVDEYQDTNRTQFELISRLAEKHRNLFVVGDDDQSIYSWRGAMPANIIEFERTYAGAIKVTLEQNYRCTATIVDAASAMIAKNQVRVKKRLFTANPQGEPLTFTLESDNETEAWWVAGQIVAEKGQFPFRDIAVFYRTNSQSRLLEDALLREGVPYQIYGTVRFYDRAEVKDVMAYLRLLINPMDDVSVRRVLNVPGRGIGKKAEEQLEAEAMRRGLPLLATARALVDEGAPKLAAKFKPFVALLSELGDGIHKLALGALIETLLGRIRYLDYITQKFPEQAADKIENIHELGAAIQDFVAAVPDATLAEWLQSVSLTSSDAAAKGGVSLMTLHMAKGLEFPRVYIVGLEDGMLPHKGSMDDEDRLEEERRLFYVGMTRAKVKLSLVGAHRRRTYNAWEANPPSRFLREIPAKFFASPPNSVGSLHAGAVHSTERRGTATALGGEQESEVRYEYDEGGPWAPGDQVRHPTYGRGVIEQILEEHQVLKAVIRFQEFGIRKTPVHHLNRA